MKLIVTSTWNLFQWPAGDTEEEDDIEENEEEEDEENIDSEKKSKFGDLYGINFWNYDSIDA